MLSRYKALGNAKGRRRNRLPSRGSQLLEFAFALPILLILVVGIWDFGKAFALKQKLTNTARQGARIVVSTPMANPSPAPGCSTTVPCAIVSSAENVKQYLTNAGLDASWINAKSPTSSSTCPYGEWVYGSGSAASAPSLTIKADVAITPTGSVVSALSAPVGSANATEVTLTWPLTWELSALMPSGVFPSQVTTTVTMVNLGGGCGDSMY